MGTYKITRSPDVADFRHGDLRLLSRSNSSQYAEAIPNRSAYQTKQIKIFSMLRHTSLNPTYCMKTSQYLSVIMFVSGIWSLLDVESSALGFSLKLPAARPTVVRALPQPTKTLAQIATVQTSFDGNKDLRLQEVVVTRNSSDKSLLTVTGTIENRSEQVHYVYYIVAKFVAKDVSIKQSIIPINIDIKPGKSQPFTHEISADSISSIVPETVKSIVVKYEYR
jgi:hypothetical protein